MMQGVARTKSAPGALANTLSRPPYVSPYSQSSAEMAAPRQSASRRRVWRSGPRPPAKPTLSTVVLRQLERSSTSLSRPEPLTPMLIRNRARWYGELEARRLKAAQLEESMRNQLNEELNTLEAQLDAVALLSHGSLFINPVDRLALMKLASTLRKNDVPWAPSPLTKPAMRRGEGQGLAALRASSDWTTAAALEAKLTATISYAHKWMRKHAGGRFIDGGREGIASQSSHRPNMSRRNDALRRRFIENQHWHHVHAEQELQRIEGEKQQKKQARGSSGCGAEGSAHEDRSPGQRIES